MDFCAAFNHRTCGGDEGQTQTQAAMVTRMIDFGDDPQQAIVAPRWLMLAVGAWNIGTRGLKPAFRQRSRATLRSVGCRCRCWGGWSGIAGHAQAISTNQDTGFMEGGADPRGDGAALGFGLAMVPLAKSALRFKVMICAQILSIGAQ